MLNGRLALHDIRDVEAFAAAILKRQAPKLQPADYEDRLAYLIEECWLLSVDFRPGGIKFSTYARTTLHRRLIDRTRQLEGRTRWTFKDHTYTRTRPHLLPLHELEHPHRGQPLDTPVHRSPDLMRILRTRDSQGTPHAGQHHRPTPRAAA